MIHNISVSSRVIRDRKQHAVRCPCGFYAYRIRSGEEALALALVHHAHHPGGSVLATHGNGHT